MGPRRLPLPRLDARSCVAVVVIGFPVVVIRRATISRRSQRHGKPGTRGCKFPESLPSRGSRDRHPIGRTQSPVRLVRHTGADKNVRPLTRKWRGMGQTKNVTRTDPARPWPKPREKPQEGTQDGTQEGTQDGQASTCRCGRRLAVLSAFCKPFRGARRGWKLVDCQNIQQ
jgi:hypothetical protein